MSRAGAGKAGSSRRGGCRRRPPTWEVSDSDAEAPAGAEAGASVPGPAEERREAARALRPEQALRRVAVRVDPAVLEDAGASILLEALSALGWCLSVDPDRPWQEVGYGMWVLRTGALLEPGVDCGRRPQSPRGGLRQVPGAHEVEGGQQGPWMSPQVPPEVWAADDQDLLLLLEPEEFVRGAVQLTQTCGPACSVPWIPSESPARPHVAVVGLDAHMWSHQPSSTRETQQPESPAVARAVLPLSWPTVEEALVLLQLRAHVDVLLVASWQELSRHVCAFTKAFAQRPFKQYQESHPFSFRVAGRWAGGERAARDGTGLRGLWWRQVRQFNRVSPAMADAVVTAFPSPRLLYQAYVTCDTERERMALLADLPVKTGDRVRPRRVGPDLSRRICLFLTTASPELLLDLGS